MRAPISGPIDLRGKVAIVTGGARGIGKATCIALAREGAKIIVCDILSAEETLAEVQKHNSKGIGLRCDVTNKAEIERVIERAIAEFERVDILVTSAGVLGKTNVPIQEISVQDWDFQLNINLKGTFLFCQGVWPIMASQQMGKIVCIGSLAGKIGGVLVGPEYSASKGGVHAMVKCLARRGMSHGIYVNGIAPGTVRTPMIKDEHYRDEMIPLGRLGEPEDIAEAVLFLASSASNFITGTVLDVNGGVIID
jgi:3-oxoacyl-[acyl-carrier protein] reductase